MSILFLHKYNISDLQETKKLSEKLGELLNPQDIVTFSGNLGAGKTTFVKFLIQSIVKQEIPVTSPTFNLVQIYETKRFPIWHFDMYRLRHSDEVFELGYEEALSEGVSLIEWPEKMQEFLPKDRLDVIIKTVDVNERVIEFIPHGEWKNRTPK
tara:strand:- start:62755 stop:63216 length:462 start_codon:yes stop_codon:yes gene_type:complete